MTNQSLKGLLVVLAVLLGACDATSAPLPTPVIIEKPLATAFLSPTPNQAELTATQSAITPTPLQPTATVAPTNTPYVGVFLGRAEGSLGFQSFQEPLFASSANSEPTPDNRRCLTPIDERVLRIWQTNNAVSRALGCPIQESFGFFGNIQLFENGAMYLQPDIQAVWAVLPTIGVGSYEYIESPPPLTNPAAPDVVGRITPSGTFGSVWVLVDGLQTRLGYGITPEQEIAIGIQRFDGGTFLIDASSGQAFALVVDGTLYGPFTLPQTTAPTPTETGQG